jgi:hypothetical protein
VQVPVWPYRLASIQNLARIFYCFTLVLGCFFLERPRGVGKTKQFAFLRI